MFHQIFEKADVDLKSLNGKFKDKKNIAAKTSMSNLSEEKNEIKILEILK